MQRPVGTHAENQLPTSLHSVLTAQQRREVGGASESLFSAILQSRHRRRRIIVVRVARCRHQRLSLPSSSSSSSVMT